MTENRAGIATWPPPGRVLHQRVVDEGIIARQRYGSDFDPMPMALVHLLYEAASKLTREGSEELAPLNLTATQFSALVALERAGEAISMRELARRTSQLPPNLTALVNVLEERGLVDRAPSPWDKRSALIRLSRQGRRLLAGFLPGHWEFLDGMFAGLTDDERLHLAELLTKFLGKPAAEEVDESRQN
jgi:DNA-binding MarR family transcriptional regulator